MFLLGLGSLLVSLVALEAVGRGFIRDPLGLFQPTALLGYEMVPDYHGRHRKLSDFDVTIRTDVRGLRVAGGEVQTPDRVALFLGDSVTFGWGVEVEQTWGAQVAQRSAAAGVAGLQSVNAGVWGYDTLQELAFLRAGAAGIRPRIVVVGLTSPVTPTRNWYCHERSVITLEPLLPDTSGAFGPMRALLKGHSHVYSFLERRIRFRGSLLPEGWSLPGLSSPAHAAAPVVEMPLEDSAALTVGLVRELRDTARSGNAELAVVVFPTLEQVIEAAGQPQPAASRERTLREHLVVQLRAAGIQSLDLTPALAAYERPAELFLPRDPIHPSRTGHALSADAARVFLAQAYPGLF